MAAGELTYNKALYAALKVLEALGTNAKPTGTADGTGGYAPSNGTAFGPVHLNRPCPEARLVVRGIVNAGQVLAGTFRLWGYSPELGDWVPLHAAVTIAETDTDEYTYTERFESLYPFTRFHIEAAATGIGAALTAYLIFPRPDRLGQ